jgi:hypothetical protein
MTECGKEYHYKSDRGSWEIAIGGKGVSLNQLVMPPLAVEDLLDLSAFLNELQNRGILKREKGNN